MRKRRGRFIYLFIYFILFYFILFYFILFYFILFYFIFFASKEAFPIFKQLEKNNGEKSGSESSKMREKQILGPWEPPLVT